MPLYRLGDRVPEVHPGAYVHPSAEIIGAVVIGEGASVWPGAVLRGDLGRIEVGPGTSVQDNSVVHPSEDSPTLIGKDCVVGHLAHLEGCVVEDAALVGSAAVLLEGAVLRTGAAVAAGALVLGGTEVPAGTRVQGVPARPAPGAPSVEDAVRAGAGRYRALAETYAKELVELMPEHDGGTEGKGRS